MNNFKEKILPFLKSYWLMLVLGVVAVAALPTALFFSAQMNTSLREEFQQQVNKDWDSVSKAKNSYYLQGVSGEKLLEKSTEYNAELNSWYKDQWTALQGKTGVVWDDGLKFNKGEHALLIKEGMFPEPPALEREVRTRELVKAVMDYHQKILADAKAGLPPDLAQLTAQLNEERAAMQARIVADTGAEPDQAAKDKMTADLLDRRVGRYRARAAELGVYADKSVFEGIPSDIPKEAPSLAYAWDLQERSWVNADVFRAISKANSAPGGVGAGVVKRVFRISIKSGGYDPSSPQPASYEPGDDKAPVDFSASPTGRISGPGTKNKWFDVRGVTIDAVVSSRRLPSFIDALAATNFISVLDLEIQPIDAVNDLRDGYYYGDEHVVRVVMQLETVWIRDWRKDWMPTDVKKALGMVEGVTVDSGGSSGATSGGTRRAPPPPPPAGSGSRRGSVRD